MSIRPQVSYPGVYVQEVQPTNQAIVGVSTSVTAFLGRTLRGPVNTAVCVANAAEFVAQFGPLDPACPLTYSVADFFENGGAQAVIVRLYHAGETSGVASVVVRSVAPWDRDEGASEGEALFELQAATPGAWGSGLRAWVDRDGLGDAGSAGDRFNLHLQVEGVRDHGAQTESYSGVTLAPGTPRSLGAVLAAESRLARVAGVGGERPPPPGAGGQGAGGVDSGPLTIEDYTRLAAGEGFNALDAAEAVNLICVPPDVPDLPDAVGAPETHPEVYAAAAAYAERRGAFVIVDAPKAWDEAAAAGDLSGLLPEILGITGARARSAAAYWPRIVRTDPIDGRSRAFPVSGAIAGLYSRTDATRGVWKAPAGTEATLYGVQGLTVALTDEQNGTINGRGVNALRAFPLHGPVVWGARTLAGADALGDDYKYVPVRRLMLFIRASIRQGTQWTVFEPNAEPLWSTLRAQVGAFMSDLFRQGALAGSTPAEAWSVRCDRTTNTEADIEQGVVNLVVAFAAVRPAEFQVLSFQLRAAVAP